MRVLYYAMGGGLGHLSRAEAFLCSQDIQSYKVITASPWHHKIFRADQVLEVPVRLQNDLSGLINFLQDGLDRYDPEIFVVDTFINGIMGELKYLDFGNRELYYITRRLKWNQYSDKVSAKLHFNKALVLEPLEAKHAQVIKEYCAGIENFQLEYPNSSPASGHLPGMNSGKDNWLIVHSGPSEEVEILVNHAGEVARLEKKKPIFYILSQDFTTSREGWNCYDQYPAFPYFNAVSRIFSGCGFNIMQQTRLYRDQHIFIPFERRYDDQFWRAGEAKKKATGKVAFETDS